MEWKTTEINEIKLILIGDDYFKIEKSKLKKVHVVHGHINFGNAYGIGHSLKLAKQNLLDIMAKRYPGDTVINIKENHYYSQKFIDEKIKSHLDDLLIEKAALTDKLLRLDIINKQIVEIKRSIDLCKNALRIFCPDHPEL